MTPLWLVTQTMHVEGIQVSNMMYAAPRTSRSDPVSDLYCAVSTAAHELAVGLVFMACFNLEKTGKNP